MTKTILLSAFLALLSASAGYAAEFYVTPTGTAQGDGSMNKPWDMQTALNQTAIVHPGDTIWVHGGTYHGSYATTLTGTAAAPIILRAYPGERATIDSAPPGSAPTWVLDALDINGDYFWVWGLEMMNSYPVRITPTAGEFPEYLGRWGGFTSHNKGVRAINLIIHDMTVGGGYAPDGTDNELYGSLSYYNGWQGPDRGHGHGVYTQNHFGPQRINDNITFNNFSHGIHAYGSGAAFLNNIQLDGNISFTNASISLAGISDGRDILYGGGVLAENPVITNNSTWTGQFNMGYGAGCSNGILQNNYLIGSFILVACDPVFTGNTIFDPVYGPQYGYGTLPVQYPNNSFLQSAPTTNKIVVRPNQYEPGRANIAIYNWTNASSVQVDVSASGLHSGDVYELHNAQNYWNEIITGTYTGSPINVPMTGWTIAAPVGMAPPPSSFPAFGVFVIQKKAGSGTSGPLPQITLTKSASPATGLSGSTVTFTIQYQNTGQGPAANVVITDVIPAGSTLVAGSITSPAGVTSSVSAGTITWTVGSLAAGATGSVSFNVTLN